ncbi:hypothetical protein Tco_0115470 [Tanacetum coccineum]
MEVRWCGCDDGGSHGGVEDEARGPVDRIDRVAGRVSELGRKTRRKNLGFAVPVFNQGDHPIACLNKAMAFLTDVASSRVTMQQVQGRQGQSYAGNSYKGECHMVRQCTQPKRPRNVAWSKEKAMLAEAH